jgi:hypothetical protein
VLIFLIKIFISSGKKEGRLSYRDIGKITKNQAYIHIYEYTGAPEPRGQRGQLTPLPKHCGDSTEATGCPFLPELYHKMCALFTEIGI